MKLLLIVLLLITCKARAELYLVDFNGDPVWDDSGKCVKCSDGKEIETCNNAGHYTFTFEPDYRDEITVSAVSNTFAITRSNTDSGDSKISKECDTVHHTFAHPVQKATPKPSYRTVPAVPSSATLLQPLNSNTSARKDTKDNFTDDLIYLALGVLIGALDTMLISTKKG